MSKSLKFAGSAVGEPWWVLGDITRRLLEPLGDEVEVLSASGSTNSPRYVGSGKADLGASGLGPGRGGDHAAAPAAPRRRALLQGSRPALSRDLVGRCGGGAPVMCPTTVRAGYPASPRG